jgi:hypothetical protein
VGRRAVRRLSERVDDVLRRPRLRVPAAEVDDVSGRGYAGEQRAEVLLGQALEALRARPQYVKLTVPATRAL